MCNADSSRSLEYWIAEAPHPQNYIDIHIKNTHVLTQNVPLHDSIQHTPPPFPIPPTLYTTKNRIHIGCV
jgi:hypothetical protein